MFDPFSVISFGDLKYLYGNVDMLVLHKVLHDLQAFSLSQKLFHTYMLRLLIKFRISFWSFSTVSIDSKNLFTCKLQTECHGLGKLFFNVNGKEINVGIITCATEKPFFLELSPPWGGGVVCFSNVM
jgi:hypothetical protein